MNEDQAKEQVEKNRAALKKEALEDFRRTATESVFYVALGKAMKKELAEKHKLEEREVEGLMSLMAVRLVDKIRNIKVDTK